MEEEEEQELAEEEREEEQKITKCLRLRVQDGEKENRTRGSDKGQRRMKGGLARRQLQC